MPPHKLEATKRQTRIVPRQKLSEIILIQPSYRYWNEDDTFAGKGLVCEIDQQWTLQEALQMAQEEPDMWEEIPTLVALAPHNNNHDDNNNSDESSFDIHGTLHPSVHASVALNQFLWEHTGGWKNTFG